MTTLTDLANKSASGSLSSGDRANLNVTFTTLITQIDSIATNATVNGVNLIGSDAADQVVQTGITASDTTTVASAKSDTTTLGIASLSIDTAANATAAVTALGTALDTLSSNQSALAAADAGLAAKSKTDAAIATNLQSAIDAIQKPDQASLQMELTQLNNQQSIDYYLISQMNTASQAQLSIFR
jgi:flagellin-like hook-associated protein FlgL